MFRGKTVTNFENSAIFYAFNFKKKLWLCVTIETLFNYYAYFCAVMFNGIMGT